MTDFQRFLTGLRADSRLGRYIPDELVRQTPEVIVLTLIQALAMATEGSAPHPALSLLERMQKEPPEPLRPPLVLRGHGPVMGKAGAR